MSHHAQILVPKVWSALDRLARFPRRSPTVPAASWLGELMEKRFGALILDDGCAWRYRDAIRRLGYVRHPNMKAQGNACDACKQVPSMATPLFFKEERRPPTATQYAEQSARAGIRSAPHAYDRRVAAWCR